MDYLRRDDTWSPKDLFLSGSGAAREGTLQHVCINSMLNDYVNIICFPGFMVFPHDLCFVI